MSHQLELFPVLAVRELGGLKGMSNPRRLEDEDGRTYVAKGIHSTSMYPYILVNEFVSNSLASFIGLPVPPHKIIEFEGTLWFGSLEETIEIDLLSPAILELEITNAEAMTHLAVFDINVRNQDRAFRNVLALKRVTRNRAEYIYELRGIDFGHSCIPPAGLGWVESQTDPSIYYRRSVLRTEKIIKKTKWISDGIEKVQSISETYINHVIQNVPGSWWPDVAPEGSAERLGRALLSWRNRIHQDALSALRGFTRE